MGDICIDGRILLKRIPKKLYVNVWTGLNFIRIGFGNDLF